MPKDLVIETVDEIPPGNPGGSQRKQVYEKIAEEARTTGKVVVIRDLPNRNLAANMRSGKYPAINPDEFEIVSRRNLYYADRFDIYIRYTGPQPK